MPDFRFSTITTRFIPPNGMSPSMKFESLALLILLFCMGCGKNVPLRGKVLDEGGNPITVGMVNFVSEQQELSRAKIQSDGSYTVGTLKETDGLPPGKYKVYVTGAEIATPPQGPARKDAMGQLIPQMGGFKKLVATKYTTEASTPLTCEVPAQGNRYDVIVEKP